MSQMPAITLTIKRVTNSDVRRFLNTKNGSRGWYMDDKNHLTYGESVFTNTVPANRSLGLFPYYSEVFCFYSSTCEPKTFLDECEDKIAEAASPRLFTLLKSASEASLWIEGLNLGEDNVVHDLTVDLKGTSFHNALGVLNGNFIFTSRMNDKLTLYLPESEIMGLTTDLLPIAFNAWENQFWMCDIPASDRETSPGVLGPKLMRCTYVTSSILSQIEQDSAPFLKQNYIFEPKHSSFRRATSGKDFHEFIACESKFTRKKFIIDATYLQFVDSSEHNKLPILMIIEIKDKYQVAKELAKHKIPEHQHRFWLSQI